MGNPKRISFLDMLGVPDADLRTKPKCSICGVLVTRENFGMSATSFENGWAKLKYYCKDCFLKPEALSPHRNSCREVSDG